MRVELDEVLPDPALVVTAAGIVILAVALWAVVSLVRGEFVQPMEAISFALVFAVVYFGALSMLGSSDKDKKSE